MSAEINDRGSDVRRRFFCGRERYTYDFGPCGPNSGWRQFDTDQDASYFGIWVHEGKRQILTFAEGDETLVTAPTAEIFRAELAALADFHGAPPPAFIVIGSDGSRTDVFDPRATGEGGA